MSDNGIRRAKQAYHRMLRRCNAEPGTQDFSHYPAKGIKVCKRWRNSQEAFIRDMGPCPPYGTMSRIDNDRGYEPKNCHWGTQFFQSRNRGCTNLLLDDVYLIHVYGSTGHWSLRELGHKFRVHHSTIGYILQGKLYKDILRLFEGHQQSMWARPGDI